MLSLQTMLQLELPHVNVISKIDILPTLGPQRTFHADPPQSKHAVWVGRAGPTLASGCAWASGTAFGLDFFTDVLDLDYLLDTLDDDIFGRRHKRLSKGAGRRA